MKVSEFLTDIKSIYLKKMVALRICNCSKAIKNDIRAWKKENRFPMREIVLEAPDNSGVSVKISVQELAEVYGMDVLSALLFMDDLIKANLKADKSDLRCLLLNLKGMGCVNKTVFTPKMLEKIKAEQPELWKEYMKLQAQEEKERQEKAGNTDPLNEDL